MLKGLTSDLTGSSDICRALKTFDAALGAQYVLPNEVIMFSLQSSKEEFTFTNQGLLKIYGSSATTTRKLVTRYDYNRYVVDHVKFETAGRVDRDVEIKFTIGGESISIDIARDEEAIVREYYKVLEMLSRAQRAHERSWEFGKLAFKHSAEALYLTEASGQTLPRQSEESLMWLQDLFDRTHPRCYRDVINAAFHEIRTNTKMLP